MSDQMARSAGVHLHQSSRVSSGKDQHRGPSASRPQMAGSSPAKVVGEEDNLMASTHRPSRDDLARAHAAFRAHESRDLFYRAATALVRLAREGAVDLTTGEAIAVLLRTWNSAYYRYHRSGTADYAAIEALISNHGDWLNSVTQRTIASLADADERPLLTVFAGFEAAPGPVGAAKALHLLAPRFMPLWDRAIAAEYVGQLGPVGSNGWRYLQFMRECREQSAAAGGDTTAADGNILKALDEYNYCVFTKRWIEP